MHGAMISSCLFVRVQLMTCKFHQKAKRKHHVKNIPRSLALGCRYAVHDAHYTMRIREAS